MYVNYIYHIDNIRYSWLLLHVILFKGGLHHFDNSVSKGSKVYVHQNESSVMLHSNQRLRNFKTASWVTPEEIVITPSSDWNCKNFQVNRLSDVIRVKENSVFDLGNFCFKV